MGRWGGGGKDRERKIEVERERMAGVKGEVTVISIAVGDPLTQS